MATKAEIIAMEAKLIRWIVGTESRSLRHWLQWLPLSFCTLSADCPKLVTLFLATKINAMRVLLSLSLLFLGVCFAAYAQDLPELIFLNTELETRPDVSAAKLWWSRESCSIMAQRAYANVRISVEVFDADEELIGEGFGFLVDACDTALLDYALPPGRVQVYEAPYEVFAASDAAQVKMSVAAQAISPATAPLAETPLVKRVAFDEVVMLEWLDEETLIYGVGCGGSGLHRAGLVAVSRAGSRARGN